MARLYSMAARGGAGMAGMWLHTIGSSAGKADKSVCGVGQEDTTEFYGFLFDLQ